MEESHFSFRVKVNITNAHDISQSVERSFVIDEFSPCIFGRSKQSSDVQLDDPAASREHFQIYSQDGKLYVDDLNTKNGTYLNHKILIDPKSLKKDDSISVGHLIIHVHEIKKSYKKTKTKTRVFKIEPQKEDLTITYVIKKLFSKK